VTAVRDLATVQGWIGEARRLVVLTGAGISTDSGIQDFRGPNGLWTKDPEAEKRAQLRYYLAEPELRKSGWRARLDAPHFRAEPNRGHRAIAERAKRHGLHALITQNVDGLHQAAGLDGWKVIEVHGTVHEWRCIECESGGPIQEALDRVRAGEDDPPCPVCGGIIKTATISFGQNLVPEVIERAFEVSAECDVLLCVGTKLSVYPVAGCVPEAKRNGARVVILNAEPTDMDHLADAVIRGSISELLPSLLLVEEFLTS
jgi:NAD-dependent deacetylase